MKKKSVIITIAALAVIAVTVGVITMLTGNTNKPVDTPTESTGSDININIPDISTGGDDVSDTEDNPVVTPGTDDAVNPDDDTITAPIETGNGDDTGDAEPSVENDKTSDVRKTDTEPAEKDEDKVTAGQKDKDATQTGPASGEDRNDAIDEEKEQGKAENPIDTEEHPVIVGDESSTADTGSKGDVVAGDEKTGTGNGGGNEPVYVDPAAGGENPFASGGDNGVTEIPAEDLIGEDDPKPGEGIHF